MPLLHDVVQRWWRGELGYAGEAADLLMTPAELLYRGVTRARNALYDQGAFSSEKLGVPVISVGNIAIGGTGKTPVAAWLARTLRNEGARPAILHGGYALDEPALHAELNPDVPVCTGRDRVATGRSAIADGANVLVLDDAFQHRRVQRDLDIVLVAAESWGRPHRTLPRGPWRESSRALARAGFVLVTRRTASPADARKAADDLRALQRNVAIVSLRAASWRHNGERSDAPASPVILVSGIADPHAFRMNAESADADVADVLTYPDHHVYSTDDARDILERAAGAGIATTAKDWVKLRALLPHERVWVLEQTVVPEDGADALMSAVRQVLL